MPLYCYQQLFNQSLKTNFKIVYNYGIFSDYYHSMAIWSDPARKWIKTQYM